MGGAAGGGECIPYNHTYDFPDLSLSCNIAPSSLAFHGEVPHTYVGHSHKCAQEMFRQGDRKRALGQSVSPLMDRARGGVTKSQTGFFNIVARPIYMVSGGPPPATWNFHTSVEMWPGPSIR